MAYAGPDLIDLYVRDFASGVSTRLTFAGKQIGNLVWSPDGRWIAYAQLTGNAGWETHLKAADGTGPDSLLFRGPGLFTYPESWSRDGRWLTMRCSSATGNMDIWVMPMDGSGKAHPYQETPASEGSSQLSPDDHWMVYTAGENGKRGLYLQSFPIPGAKYQIAEDHAGGAGWNLTGDALVMITDDQTLIRYPVSTANGFTLGPPTRLCQIQGPTFLMDVDLRGKRLLTGKPKDLAASTWLDVVLDWPELLQRP